MPNLIYSSVFGDLTKTVQVRFDAVSELHKRLFDNVIFEQFLDWDVPTIGLDFNEIIGQYNITVAAPTIGNQSKEAILGSYGLETLKESVLTHAVTLPMGIDEYRKVLALLDSKYLADRAKTEQLVKLMWGNVTRVVDSVLAKIDMIFLGALSNEGVFTLDDTTNPEGGVKGQINYNQPATNIATATTAWTDANIETVDCFEDIQAVIDVAQSKVTFAKVLLAPALVSYMCRSKKIKQMVWGVDKSAQMVLLSDLNAYMASKGLPVFEPLRREVVIQNGLDRTPYTPWNANNMVFIPEGKLGVVKNAFANSEIRPEAGVAYSNYGRVRVSQWGVGETQGSNGIEFTKAEVLALPVITEMNGIYTLKTQS